MNSDFLPTTGVPPRAKIMGIVDALPEWHGTKPKLSLPGGALTLVGETKLSAVSLAGKGESSFS